MLALQAAAKECKHLSGCRAVTAFVGTDFQKNQEYEFRFVTGVEPCTADPEYRTVQLPADSKGSQRRQWGGPAPLEVLAARGATLVQENPPIAKFDGFLSDDEIQHIMELARPRFVRSTTGMTYDSGDSRTSETAWLNAQQDSDDAVLANITARITELTRLPHEHMEPFQVVRYQAGQFFQGHQDYLDAQEEQVCGGRVGTFFMYLNDVPEGGQTHFAKWDLTITPRKGLALLWWNVNYTALQHGIFGGTKDMDAWHQSLPVVEGEKWVVNRWLHPYDFLTPYFEGKLR
ncbi:P4H6 [Symbiodinium sp. CCMP2456]|nr:P4H6 [Symbiodinium sp. CCMP2456]